MAGIVINHFDELLALQLLGDDALAPFAAGRHRIELQSPLPVVIDDGGLPLSGEFRRNTVARRRPAPARAG